MPYANVIEIYNHFAKLGPDYAVFFVVTPILIVRAKAVDGNKGVYTSVRER